jgi:hypothetical protein
MHKKLERLKLYLELRTFLAGILGKALYVYRYFHR